ncbi:MAG: hypothetical protein IKJ59_05280 [Clostridia bacterium]|nr:hypothetical protein [Clostridia bacterium]
MGKRKKAQQTPKKTVIGNIEQINLEIDYDKLAESIVKASKIEDEKRSLSREWMKFVITPIFWLFTVISGLFAIGFFVEIFQIIKTLKGNISEWEQWITIAVGFILSLFFVVVCIFTIATAREIEKENNKQYVAAMFSNIVALVALIVALIALFKGVG